MRGKWMAGLLAALALLVVVALAEEEGVSAFVLPETVTALCASAYPDYTVGAYDGWGSEAEGQFALVLTDGQNPVLCIAEKAQGDAGYAFTVENPNAVREGDALPALMVDGKDALYYTYDDGDCGATVYHAVKENGAWGDVDCVTYGAEPDAYSETRVGLNADGMLVYEETIRPAYDTLVTTTTYAPIPVDAAYADDMRLGSFDISQLATTLEYGVYLRAGMADGLLTDGEALLGLDVKPDCLVQLVEKPDGTRCLRIAQWDDASGTYAASDSGAVWSDAYLDAWRADKDTIVLTGGGLYRCSFRCDSEGVWRLRQLLAQGEILFTLDGVQTQEETFFRRNDCTVYGVSPWSSLLTLDFASLPETLAQALDGIDSSAYALVNNPDPEERLNLRAEPSTDADSLGKFYNRTPVRVLSVEGEWAHVRIGWGEASLTGYMMTDYLAMTEAEKANVVCAFPQKHVLTAYADSGVPVHSEPDEAGTVVGVMREDSLTYVLGVAPNEWAIVLLDSGAVGYVQQMYLWEGNC